MKIIGMIICWFKQRHDWSDWQGIRYYDGRTWYQRRKCFTCDKQETRREITK